MLNIILKYKQTRFLFSKTFWLISYHAVNRLGNINLLSEKKKLETQDNNCISG